MQADLTFLTRSNIIDYSLLVGIDTDGVLVTGIVDYQSEYNLLKAIEGTGKRGFNFIEHKIKEAVVGGAGKKPDVTIQSPQRYKERMLVAMDAYFPAVPDKWSVNPEQPLEG
eukprot:Partr_v1_DN28424_c1_g1_i1_m41481